MAQDQNQSLKYGIDDKPGFLEMLLYGAQWWVVSVPFIIIMGSVIAKLHHADLAEQTLYVQKLFVISGVAGIVQVLFGHRLPLVIGPSAILVVGFLASTSSSAEAIYTSLIVGGALIAALGASGALRVIHKVFTPRVVTVVLMLLAFTMVPVVIGLVSKGTDHLFGNVLFALGLFFALFIAGRLTKGIVKSTVILWGIILGSIAYLLIFPDHAALQSASSGGGDLFLMGLDFEPGVLIAFLFCFMALLVNELGSVESVSFALKADNVEGRTRRGVVFTGLANMASGGLGVIGPVDYSLSVGIIASTRCASRFPLIITGLMLIACAFSPQAIAVLVAIPAPVMGALLLFIMTSQLSSGFMLLVGGKCVEDFDSGVVVGAPLMIALLISGAPAHVLELSGILRPVFGNGFVMGVITVLLLEHVVFRKRKT